MMRQLHFPAFLSFEAMDVTAQFGGFIADRFLDSRHPQVSVFVQFPCKLVTY